MSPGPLLRPSEWLPPAKSAPANGLAVPTNGAIPPLAASKRERSLRALEARMKKLGITQFVHNGAV